MGVGAVGAGVGATTGLGRADGGTSIATDCGCGGIASTDTPAVAV